jgi:hypothetical protein
MLDNIQKISRKLDKLLHTRLESPGTPEPPRLVRANSAFDMLFSFMGKPGCKGTRQESND